jgi:hypothetical protein
LIGQLLNKNCHYELILCDSKRNEIGMISYTDLTFNARFDSFNELNFVLSYYQNGCTNIKDKNYDLTKGLLQVLMNIKEDDTVIYSEYFVINKPTKSSNDTITKSIDCISYAEYIFNSKRLRGYKDTRKLYDYVNQYNFSDNSKGGLLNLLLTNYLYDTWSIGYLNPVLNIYHSFDFPDSSYTDVFKTLEKEYNCFIFFDSINRKINFYDKSEYGENTGLVLSNANFIKSISNEDKFEQLITRLTITGKNSVGIHKYNVTGRGYVESYDWLIENNYFSDSLKTAWNNYKALLASKEGQFTTYVNQLDSYEASKLQRENELASLKIEKSLIEDALDLEKNEHYSSSDSSTYDNIYDDLEDKEAEISSKESQINSLQSSINSVNANITNLRNILSYSSNFTQEQLEELVEFIREQSISFDQVSDQKQLYEYAKVYIEKVSKTPLVFDTDNIDIFTAEEGELVRNKVIIGNFANIDCPELGFDYYPIRIVAFTHKPLSHSLSMNFSNTDKLENELALVGKNIFKAVEDIDNELDIKKYEYERYSNDSDRILYSGNAINTDNNPIIAGDNIISRRGFLGEDIGSSGGVLQILKDKIIISSDKMRTWNTLLSGNGLYLESDSGKSRTVLTGQYGFQIDQYISGQGWDNVFYIDSSTGSLHIDGAYIELLTANHMNRFLLNPSDAFRIQANVGTVGSPIWDDRFFVSSAGDLVARELRTDSSTYDYIRLREQYIDFYNGGLKKIQMGFTSDDGFPYMQFGAGSGGTNYMFMYKNTYGFYMDYAVSSGYPLGIAFLNDDSEYPEGAIQFAGVVDFSYATVIGI